MVTVKIFCLKENFTFKKNGKVNKSKCVINLLKLKGVLVQSDLKCLSLNYKGKISSFLSEDKKFNGEWN